MSVKEAIWAAGLACCALAATGTPREGETLIGILNDSPSRTTGYGIPLTWSLRYSGGGSPAYTRTEHPDYGTYQIYRDGKLLATVSETSGYTDYDVNAGETHSYSVSYLGFSWRQDFKPVCYQSVAVMPELQEVILLNSACAVGLAAVAMRSDYVKVDPKNPRWEIQVKSSSYSAGSDRGWIAEQTDRTAMTSFNSGSTSVWSVAANTTGEDRVGHVAFWPSGYPVKCAVRSVETTVIQTDGGNDAYSRHLEPCRLDMGERPRSGDRNYHVVGGHSLLEVHEYVVSGGNYAPVPVSGTYVIPTLVEGWHGSGNDYRYSVCMIDKLVGSAGQSAYQEVTNLVVSEGIVTLGTSACANCTKLESVSLPSTLKVMSGCFAGCTALTEISIPDGVTVLDQGAFSGCSSLRFLALPAGLPVIGDYVFSGCTSLESLALPSACTVIGQYAFRGCSSLTNVSLGACANIGLLAFSDCTSLRNVTIPNSVTNVGLNAFSGCPSMLTVTFEGVPPAGLSAAGISSDAFVLYDPACAEAWQPIARSGLFAAVEPKDTTKYLLEFKSNGGTSKIPAILLERGEVRALPNYSGTHGNDHFAGWACSNGRRYDDGMLVFDLAQPGETVTMTAIWE